jgi:hypothetical protein
VNAPTTATPNAAARSTPRPPAAPSRPAAPASAPARRAAPPKSATDKRGSPAARIAFAALVALATFFAGVQLALRWEASSFHALGTLQLPTGKSVSGEIGINWSGDLVVSSVAGAPATEPTTVAITSLRSLVFVGLPTDATPWRLVVGLALAFIGSVATGLAVFSARWRR